MPNHKLSRNVCLEKIVLFSRSWCHKQNLFSGGGGGGDGDVDDDDDDSFLKVMLYYNFKAVSYFANPHDRAMSVRK